MCRVLSFPETSSADINNVMIIREKITTLIRFRLLVFVSFKYLVKKFFEIIIII